MAWLELGSPFIHPTELDGFDVRRRAHRSAVLIVVGLALAAMAFLWTPWIHGNDGVRNYVYVRSLFLDGDLSFANEFDRYVATGELPEYRLDNLTGRAGNGQAIGSSVLWAPFFLAGHLVAKIGPWEADGYSPPYAWAICLGTTFYAMAGLVLMLRVVAWRFDTPSALVAVLAVWWGSPLWFYMYLHPSMSHGCSFFVCALLVWMYERWRDTQDVWHFFLIGLAGGLAVATRYNNGVFLLVPLAFAGKAIVQGMPGDHALAPDFRLRLSIFLMSLGLLIGAFPQMAAWRYFYDAWLAGPQDYNMGANLPGWSSPWSFHVLFSAWRGLFVWSPVLLPATIGFFLLVRYLRILDCVLAVALLVQLWVIGGWTMWFGGASYGQRFFINFCPLFMIGLGFLYRALGSPLPRRLLLAFLLAGVVWSGGLAVQYVGGIVDREAPLALGQLTRNQFTRAPRWAMDHAAALLPGRRDVSGPRSDESTEANRAP